MAIPFKAAKRVNPRDPNQPAKYYAKIKGANKVKFEELVELISKISILNYGDIMGSLGAFLEIIELQLRQGREVELGDLGTFYLTLNSEGAETPGDLTVGYIIGARIRFRPGKRLKKMTKSLDFRKEI